MSDTLLNPLLRGDFKVSLCGGCFKWIPAFAGMTGGSGNDPPLAD